MFACHISPEEQRSSAGAAMITTPVEIETASTGTDTTAPVEAGIGGKLTVITSGLMLLGLAFRLLKPGRR